MIRGLNRRPPVSSVNNEANNVNSTGESQIRNGYKYRLGRDERSPKTFIILIEWPYRSFCDEWIKSCSSIDVEKWRWIDHLEPKRKLNDENIVLRISEKTIDFNNNLLNFIFSNIKRTVYFQKKE